MSIYNQNSGYGRAMLDAIHASIGGTFGNVFVVLNSSDSVEGNYQHLQDVFLHDADGRVRFYTSLSAAYDATESNNNDVIILDGNTTHSLSSMLTVSNNRVHFIGLDYLLGIHRNHGQSTRVSLDVTTAATDIATLQVTGVRCSFRGIKFINSNTVAQGIYCIVDAGEYTYWEDCEIIKETDLDQTGAADLVCNGDSSIYKNCYIGGTSYDISGAIIRANVLMTREIVSGKVARDVIFDSCLFARKSSNSANRFVYGANATDIERICLFKDCIFWNAKLSAGTPAQNVAFGASQTEGEVLLLNCAAQNAGTAMSTTTGVFVAGTDQGGDSTTEGAAQIGISVQAT
jgi:hypothetical protein